ncbi:LysR family transcriptional regulator [Robbsia sp. KACC 23696]|uniref:LysR family transcriptional regulator n=1 Tax=Robbsia sp. KACC 23696 TaxID=3149231 RepID=UPI00325B9A01
MPDRLTSMAVFVLAAETGSFAAAAQKLEMSPQMVAKHVESLEHRVGTRLLHRTTRKQSLTEFGRLYLARCERVIAEADAADELASAAQRTPSGRLRVNASLTFGRYGLMPAMSTFLRAHPAVSLELTLSDRVVDPLEGGFEVLFRIGPIADNTAWVARPLQPYRLLACASPDYLARYGIPTAPADLADHQTIGFAPWPAERNRQWHFLRDGRDFVVSVESRLMMNDWFAMHHAALDGFGIVAGYERALLPDVAAGRLVRVLPEYEIPTRPMHLLYAVDRLMTPKLRCFVDAMVGAFGA